MNNHSGGILRICRLTVTCCLFAWQLSAQTVLPPLPVLDSLTEVQIAGIALQLQSTSVAQRQVAELQLHNAQSLRTTEETALSTLKADTLAAKDQLALREKNLKSAKNAEKVAQRNFKQTEKNITLAQTTLALDSLARRKGLPKLQRQLADMQLLLYPPPPAVETAPVAVEAARKDTSTPAPVADTNIKKEKKPELPGKKYRTYDPLVDVMLHPPAPPCALATDRHDEFSGELQRESARAELFRSTNPVLKTYLEGKIQILCEAALSMIGQNATLILTFTIRDPNVRKSFGSLPKNSIATLQTLDGTVFTVYNQQMSEGQPDETGQVFTYRGHYPLDKTIFKKLRTTGLDKVRIAWSTGYEDYEVQNVDLLIRQAQCMEP